MEGHKATDKVGELRGVSWEWRPEAPAGAQQQPGLGVLAQDVEAVFPELVETGPDGLKQVNYAGLLAPMIEAIKELDRRLSALESQLANPPAPNDT